MTPMHFRTPLTDRQLRRLRRRFELAVQLGDVTVLNDDGTGTVYRGQRGWLRVWLKLRMWFA